METYDLEIEHNKLHIEAQKLIALHSYYEYTYRRPISTYRT